MHKKLFSAVLLILVLVLTLGITAFADEEIADPVTEEPAVGEIVEMVPEAVETLPEEPAGIEIVEAVPKEVETLLGEETSEKVEEIAEPEPVVEEEIPEAMEEVTEPFEEGAAAGEPAVAKDVETEETVAEEVVIETETVEEQPVEEAPQISYSITFSNGTTSFDTIGGTQVAVKDILAGLGYDVEDAVITVNPDSVDTSVIQVVDTENGPVLSDFGPFSEANQKLVAYINGEAVELSVIDPFDIEGTQTSSSFAYYFDYSDDGNVRLVGDVTIVDGPTNKIVISKGNHTLYLNGYKLNGADFDVASGAKLDILEPLTFTAEEAGSRVTFDYASGENVQYLKNSGTWTNYTKESIITLDNAGDRVSFKGSNVSTNWDGTNFVMTGTIAASGDVTSLTNGVGGDATLSDYCYASMFQNCTSLTSAPNLPATTMKDSCYYNMFYGCTNLTTAPALPATTLCGQCYNRMFGKCAKLITAPDLPATTLAPMCYSSMFGGCTNLTAAPDLPATTLAYMCYYSMFGDCTNLTAAPDLPATTLAYMCYHSMFVGCTNLTTAPDLPATTLAGQCYHSMFEGCTSLTTAPDLPATTLAYNCYFSMFEGCTNLKTAPAILPAIQLAEGCYSAMFSGCTSLKTVSTLPATKLEASCYSEMFANCSALKIHETNTTEGIHGIIILNPCPDTSAEDYCLDYMFYGTDADTSIQTRPKAGYYYYIDITPSAPPSALIVNQGSRPVVKNVSLDSLSEALQNVINETLKANNVNLVGICQVSENEGGDTGTVKKTLANIKIDISSLKSSGNSKVKDFDTSTLQAWKVKDDNTLEDVNIEVQDGKIVINNGERGTYIFAAREARFKA